MMTMILPRKPHKGIILLFILVLFGLSFLQDNYIYNFSGHTVPDHLGNHYSSFFIPHDVYSFNEHEVLKVKAYKLPISIIALKDILFALLFMGWTMAFAWYMSGKKAVKLLGLFYIAWATVIVCCYAIAYGLSFQQSLIHKLGFVLFDVLKTYGYAIIIALLFIVHTQIRRTPKTTTQPDSELS